MKNLLSIRGFLPFIAIMFINASVDLGHKITIQNILVKSFDANTLVALTSLVNLLILLPYVMFFSPAGFVNDKFSRTKITRACAILGVVLTFLITIGYYFGFFYFAFIMTLLLALQSAVYSPAKYGLVKKIVGAKNLGAANGVVQGVTIISILLASLVFSVIFQKYALNGKNADEIIHSVWFIGAILCVLSLLETFYAFKIPYFQASAPNSKFDAKKYIKLSYLKQNLRYVVKDKNVLLCTLGLSLFWAVSQLVIATFPAHFKDLNGSDNVAMIQGILALSGIGIAIGSLIAGSYCKKHIELGIVPFGAFGLFVALMILANANSVFWMSVASFLFGLSGGIFIVPLNANIQFFTPDDRMGRVLAGSNFIQNLFMILFLIFAVLFAKFAVRTGEIFVMAALCVLICAMFGVRYLPQLFVRILALPFLKFGFKVNVDGVENIPVKGGVLLLGNHISWIDWAVVQIATPRAIRFVMHKSIYELWYLKWFLKFFGIIPIGAGVSKSAIEEIKNALNKGEVVALFPEGHISYNGRIDEFQSGFELAARDSNAIIVPFYIRGLWGSTFSRATQNYKKSIKLGGKSALRVSFGTPMDINSSANEVKSKVVELSFFSWEKYLNSLRPIPYNWLKQAKAEPFKRVLIDSSGLEMNNLKAMATTFILISRLKNRIKNDKNIGVILPNSVIGSLVNLALFIRSKVSVNLNYTQSPEILVNCANIAELNTIITSKIFAQKLKDKGFDIQSAFGDRLVYLEEIMQEITKGEKILAFLTAFIVPKFLIELFYFKDTRIEDDAVILFSSGSEGTPKGVVLTHKNLMANIKQMSELVNADTNDAILASLPIFHSFGLTVTAFLPLNDGITSIHVPDPTDAFNVGKACAKYGATIMFGTTTFFRIYTRAKKLNPLMFGTIRLAVSGAEKLNEATKKEIKMKFGITSCEGYGATETAPVVAINTPNILEPEYFKELVFNKAGSVGLTLSGTVIKVVDLNSFEELKRGEEGLILIGGPQVMRCYYKNPQKTDEVIRTINDVRYYVSGDIGYLDDDGFLFITDRVSRFAKIGGEMISLGAVENALSQVLDEDIHFSCVSLEDDKKGEKIVLLYTGEADEFEIFDKIKFSNLSNIMRPSVIKKVDEIPILGSGKVNFKATKKLAMDLEL